MLEVMANCRLAVLIGAAGDWQNDGTASPS